MDHSHYEKINLLAHIFVIRKASNVIQQPPGSLEVEIPQDPGTTFRRKFQVNMD